MRLGWKHVRAGVAGAGLAAICTAVIIVGSSRVVQGDTTAPAEATATSSSPSLVLEGLHDPNTPYPLGPGAIEFEQLSAADRAAVEQIQETVETSQPPSSLQAWSAATAATGELAEAEITARSIGLVGTDNDGVVP